MGSRHLVESVSSNTGRWALRLEEVSAPSPGPEWRTPLTLTVSQGSRVGVVGANGSGKSTLLALIAGNRTPAAGRVRVAPGVSLGHLPQEVSLETGMTVRQSIEAGASRVRSMLSRHKELAGQLAVDSSQDLLDELGALVESLDLAHGWDFDAQITQAMAALGCPDPCAVVDQLSAGERRRVALCRLLMSRPSLLLLDEPSNDLDLGGLDWLEHFLQAYSGTVVFATHDRQLLSTCADWIVELDRTGLHRYRGGYRAYVDAKIEDFIVLGRRDADQLRTLEYEQVRSSSPQPSRRRLLNRPEQGSDPLIKDLGLIPIPAAARLGHDVLTCESLTIRAADRLLVEGLSFTVPPGAVVGVVGPNGVGKTTLLRTLAGCHAPSGGALRVGPTVSIGFTDAATFTSADATAAEVMSARGDLRFGGSVLSLRSFLAAFGFRGADQDKPLSLFSGGERARLNLALTFSQQANFLLLDEPTNELDLTYRIALERSLEAFQGSVMVTSHDRWFLHRLATHLLVWDGSTARPGVWRWVDGGLADLAGVGPFDEAGRGPHRRFPRR